jgi:hypothetical protein
MPNPAFGVYERPSPPIGRSDTISHPVLQPISTEHAASVGIVPTRQRRLSEETVETADGEYGRMRESEEARDRIRYSDLPAPSLAPIDSVGGIDLPSRFNSNASRFTATTYNTAAEVPSRYNSTSTEVPSRYDSTARTTAAPSTEPSAVPENEEWLRAVDDLNWDHSGPAVPRRSSRRHIPDHTFDGFDSMTYKGDMTEQESSSGSRAGVVDVGKAVRSTKVSTHRAVDSFTRNSIGASAALRESHAEVEGSD